MSVFKEGQFWWFEFCRDGKRYRKSTKQKNFKAAQDIERAFQSQLALGKAGIGEHLHVPTLSGFRERFIDHVTVECAQHPQTVDYYTRKFDALLKYKPLADAHLDQIGEELIDRFKAHLLKQNYQRATVNHCLRTLKRSLRLAARWKLTPGAPYIQLLSGEHEREFVLTRSQEAQYLSACPPFLRNAATLMLETGFRRKELIELEWSDVHFDPAGNARRGYLQVRGTKSRNSRRNLSLTARARSVLLEQQEISQCDHVFVKDTDPTQPASASALDHAHQLVRKALGFSAEFVLHSLRHTFATRLGESGADAFVIQRVMGHSTVVVSQRYVHPTPATMELAFDNLEAAAEKEISPPENPPAPVRGSRMVQ